MEKIRLDQLIFLKGLASSRKEALRLILANQVLVSDQPVTKAGHLFSIQTPVRLRHELPQYVSRGAWKLKKALEEFSISVVDKIALDIGASTGGFTDVLLQNGIKRVHAIDVGHGQMSGKIRQNNRVQVQEKKNARYLIWSDIQEKVDVIVIDVSFISLKKILPGLVIFCHSQTDFILLIKPQFEIGRNKVGKGGIVTDSQEKQKVLDDLKQWAKDNEFFWHGVISSPILGTKGNEEFLTHWRKNFSEKK